MAFPDPCRVDERSEALGNEMSCWKSYNGVTVAQPNSSVCLLSLGHGYGRKENSSNPDPENSSGLGKSALVGKNVWGKGVSQEDAPQTLHSGNLVCSTLCHPAFHRPPLGRSQRRPGHRNFSVLLSVYKRADLVLILGMVSSLRFVPGHQRTFL